MAQSILITPDEALVDTGEGKVLHLKPKFLKVKLPNGKLVEFEAVLDAYIDKYC